MSPRTSATRMTVMATVLLAASLSGCLGFLEDDDLVTSFDDAFALHGEIYEADGVDNGTVRLKLIQPDVHDGLDDGVHDLEVLLFTNATGVTDANVSATVEGTAGGAITAAKATLAHTDHGLYEGTIDATGIDNATLAFDVLLADGTALVFTIEEDSDEADTDADAEGNQTSGNGTAAGGNDTADDDANETAGNDTAGNNTTAGPEPTEDSWSETVTAAGDYVKEAKYTPERGNATLNVTIRITSNPELAGLKVTVHTPDGKMGQDLRVGGFKEGSAEPLDHATGTWTLIDPEIEYTLKVSGRGVDTTYELELTLSYE